MLFLVLYAVYVLAAVVLMLNLLIAMLNNSARAARSRN